VQKQQQEQEQKNSNSLANSPAAMSIHSEGAAISFNLQVSFLSSFFFSIILICGFLFEVYEFLFAKLK
jgi:hypothetical protein